MIERLIERFRQLGVELMSARAEGPAFARRETAWVWVPYRVTTAVGMMGGGAAAALLGAINALGAGGGVALIHWSVALAGALLAAAGARLAWRRDPVLTVGTEGITASLEGSDRSRLPWDLITGVRVVGERERHLVVLVNDREEALRRIDPKVAPRIRRMNHLYDVPGGLYVTGRLMGTPPEEAAEQIKRLISDIAVELEIARAGAGAAMARRAA
jgi:hypothetical protein